jgi:hypothetical protein
LHILSGKLELTIGSDVTVLEPGDSIYFDSNLRHAYRSLNPETCTALMVLAYPERNVSERRIDNLAALHGGGRHAATLTRVNGTLPALEPAAHNGKDSAATNGTPAKS